MGGAKKIVNRTVKNTVKGAVKTVKNPSRLVKNPGKILEAVPIVNAFAPGGKRSGGAGSSGGAGKLSSIEKRAGVKAPQYESLRGPDGQLRADFKYDPTKSAAFLKLQEQAMSAPGESPWAKMQFEKQALEEQGLMDQTAASQAQALAQAQGQLMRQGGLSSGARTRLASQGAKDMMLAQQQARRAGMMDRLGIGEQDIGRQQDLLGRVSSTELEGQGQNLQSMLGDVKGKQAFDMERYGQQMAAYGAEQTARGQEKAAKKSRKK